MRKEGDQRCAGWYLGFLGWELKRLVRKQRLMRMWRQTPEWNGLKIKRGEDLEALNIGCCCKSRQWNCGDCKSRWGRGLCKMYSGIWSERLIPQAGSLLLDYLYVRFMNYLSGLLIPIDSVFIVTSEWSCLRAIMQRLIEEDTQCPTLASANTLRGVPIYTFTSINHTPQCTHTKPFLYIYTQKLPLLSSALTPMRLTMLIWWVNPAATWPVTPFQIQTLQHVLSVPFRKYLLTALPCMPAFQNSQCSRNPQISVILLQHLLTLPATLPITSSTHWSPCYSLSMPSIHILMAKCQLFSAWNVLPRASA